jgi:hypothetical protein
MLIASIGVHKPELAGAIVGVFRKYELPAIRRPILPESRIIRAQIRELPHIVPVGIHRVNVPSGCGCVGLNESYAAVEICIFTSAYDKRGAGCSEYCSGGHERKQSLQ